MMREVWCEGYMSIFSPRSQNFFEFLLKNVESLWPPSKKQWGSSDENFSIYCLSLPDKEAEIGSQAYFETLDRGREFIILWGPERGTRQLNWHRSVLEVRISFLSEWIPLEQNILHTLH